MRFLILVTVALAFFLVVSAAPVKEKTASARQGLPTSPTNPDPNEDPQREGGNKEEEEEEQEDVAEKPAPQPPLPPKPESKPEEEEAKPAPQPDEDKESEEESDDSDKSDDSSKDKKKEGEGPETDKESDEEEKEEENADYFEGDLKLTEEEIEELKSSGLSKRDAVSSAARKWTNARVPYILDRSFDASRKKVLSAAIKLFNEKTCVRFVPKKASDKNHVRFMRHQGCYSTGVGKRETEGEQRISIGNRCNYLGTVIHEMMHAIGFFHEQSRLDRDEFIDILWGNIEKDRERQFWNYAHGEADYLGEKYDYASVMHYHRTAFGVKDRNGRPMTTIVPKGKGFIKLGQREGFSDIDLRQINKLYKCKKFL